MTAILAAVCIAFMILCLGLHLFGLPANWLILGFAALWAFASPQSTLTSHDFIILGALALVGELLEFLMLHIWGKKYGGSGKGTFGGMIGAFAGAIVGAPFFLGIGAFFGALAGAFLGSLAVELLRGQSNEASLNAAWGTMLGRFGGTVLKVALGFAMIAYAGPRIWPG